MTPNFQLTVGDIVRAAGLEPNDVLVIRHTYQPDGIPTPADVTPESLLRYTRGQALGTGKISGEPPRHWLVFMAEAGRRGRLVATYENNGEVVEERTESNRFFDLTATDLLDSMEGRLVIEWTKDPVNWAKSGEAGAALSVVEIATAGTSAD